MTEKYFVVQFVLKKNKNMSDLKKVKRYCSKCGSEMIKGTAPAEIFCNPRIPSSFNVGCDKYDRITGKKYFIKTLKCPKYRNTFLGVNKHDFCGNGEPFIND